MITLDRVLARQARAVFRKLLGRRSSDYGPPLKISGGPDGIDLEVVAPQGAARYHQTGSFPADETLLVPLAMLDDCQASRPGPVTLERQRGSTVTAQWSDGQVPQLVEYGEAELSRAHDFPALPESWTSHPPALLSALHEAMETVDPMTVRPTLNCIQVSGMRGRIAATDGRHLYLHDGFAFGWQEEVLMPTNPVFGCRELPQDQPVELGISPAWLAVRIGSWTILLPRQIDGTFPDVDSAIPSPHAATTTACLARDDMAFLRHSLAKLRTEEGLDLPVTVDLNGSVVVRCQPAGQPKPTELVLSNSTRKGEQVSFNASRTLLLRALELGLDKLHVVSSDAPVLWTTGNRRYVWAPFSADDTIPASDNVIRLASPIPGDVQQVPTTPRRTNAAPCCNGQSAVDCEPALAPRLVRKKRAAAGSGPPGIDGLIKRAEALHTSLRETLAKNRELLTGLKHHRRQARLVRSTLSSLKQLQGIGE